MYGRWMAYRLRMQAVRQKYFTFMKRNIITTREKVMRQMRTRILKGITYTVVLGAVYYEGNEIFSEYHEIKKIK